MKRPILGVLAAAFLSLGLLGTSPVRAAASSSPTALAASAQHGEDHERGRKYSHPHRQGGTRVHEGHHGHHRHRDHDHDHDGNGHNGRRRCSGLIVVCLG